MAASPRPSSPSIVKACHRLAEKGYAPGAAGNISLRSGSATMLITRSGARLSSIRVSDILAVRFSSMQTRARIKPSSEMPLHVALYSHHSSIKAIVHAHPPFATAFAVSGTPLTPNILPELILELGDVPLVRYAMPSSPELGALVARHADTANAAILANHGAVTWGHTLEDATRRMELLEHAAATELHAHVLGGARQLHHEQVSELLTSHPLSHRKNL